MFIHFNRVTNQKDFFRFLEKLPFTATHPQDTMHMACQPTSTLTDMSNNALLRLTSASSQNSPLTFFTQMTSEDNTEQVDLTGQCSIENIACLFNTSISRVYVIPDESGFMTSSHSARDSTAFLYCFVTLMESIVKLKTSTDVIFQLPSTHCAPASEQECSCTFRYDHFADSFLKSSTMYAQVFRKLHQLDIKFVYI